MNYKIETTKVSKSRLPEIDFDKIPFGRTFSDHMFSADYVDGEWTNFQIVPFSNLSLSPVNLALHYGQSIFEGMKASKMNDGTPALLRPEMHVRRLNASADRLCMPNFPEDLFVQALHELVGLDAGWIPQKEGSALYIRPLMFATDEKLGVTVSDTYKFLIITGPVGPYYPKPVKLYADTQYIRAADGGVGEAKTAGNYAASLYPAKKAMQKGYDQILWLDAKEFKYIQEVGTMNIFFVIDGKVITPATTGTILKGITRMMSIEILRDKGYEVEERLLTIQEVVEAHRDGRLQEVFGTGTAAVVSNVELIHYDGTDMKLPPTETHAIAHLLKNEINGIRSGAVADQFGWVVPVAKKETVKV
ncbi:MAG: branched-chain amino acid aminotransferase [Bacteroidota bacterium]